MEISETLKGLIFKAVIAVFAAWVFLFLSVSFYGLLYYFYIPAVAHIKPVHLQYDMSCFKGKDCDPKFPFDNITLIESGYKLLRGGQEYAIEIVLEMPESERNWIQGIFMIKLDMISSEGKLITSSHRAAMLHYRSPMFKLFYTLFFMPGLLAGSFEEKQNLVVPLFEEYVEDSYNSAYFAHVEIQAQTIEVYSSVLRIHAQFAGLRYLMYYWPVTSAVIGTGGIFLFIVTLVGLLWFWESTKTQSNQVNLEQSQVTLTTKSQTQPRNLRVDALFRFLTPGNNPASDGRRTSAPQIERGISRNEDQSGHDDTVNNRALDRIDAVENNSVDNIDIENIPRHRDTVNNRDLDRTVAVENNSVDNIDIENIPRHREPPNNEIPQAEIDAGETEWENIENANVPDPSDSSSIRRQVEDVAGEIENVPRYRNPTLVTSNEQQ